MSCTNDVGVKSQGSELCSDWHINANKAEVILMNSKYDLLSVVECLSLGAGNHGLDGHLETHFYRIKLY